MLALPKINLYNWGAFIRSPNVTTTEGWVFVSASTYDRAHNFIQPVFKAVSPSREKYLPSITECEHLIGFNVNSQMIYHFIDIMRLINPLPSWVLSNAFLFKIWWYNLIFDIKPYGYRCKFDVHIYKDGPVKTALIGEIYLPITPCCLVQLTSINNFRTLYTPRDMNHLPISEHNWVFQIYWEHILSSCYFDIVEWSYF